MEENCYNELRVYFEYLLKISEIEQKNTYELFLLNKIIKSNMDLLKSIEILIENNSSEGIEELTRCYFERSLQVMFILKDDHLLEKRLLSYEYVFLKGKELSISSNKIVEALKTHLKSLGISDLEELECEELKTKINSVKKPKRIAEELKKDRFSEVKNEIKRLGRDVEKFYECFSDDNVNSFAQLCNFMDYKNYYLVEYAGYSKKVHGNDILRNNVELNHIERFIFDITFELFKKYVERLLKKEDYFKLCEQYFIIKIQRKMVSQSMKSKILDLFEEIDSERYY